LNLRSLNILSQEKPEDKEHLENNNVREEENQVKKFLEAEI
jgi:hypothetical protein